MNRYSLVAVLMAVAPAFARGDQPAPPQLMQPLPVSPTVPPDACDAGCAKRPGLLQSLTARLGGKASTCDTTCPTPAGGWRTPRITVKGKACAGDGCCGPDRRSAWAKLKEWYCWKPCGEQLLPVFVPEPYHAPLQAYFPYCEEPARGVPCGPGGCKHGKKKCDQGCATATGCATAAAAEPAVGPVVPQFKYYPGTTGAAPAVAPAPRVVPTPSTTPPPANPISRPFTTP